MSIKLAVFDFDGTLADTFPVFHSCYAAIAEKRGLRNLDAAQLMHLRSLSTRDILNAMHLPIWKVPLVARDFRQAMLRRRSVIRPFKGICEMMLQLRSEGLQLAIVTSNSRELVHKILGAETCSCFTTIECGAALFGKGQRLSRVIDALGVDLVQTIYVGDETRDAHAAAKTMTHFGAVGWGYNNLEVLVRTSPRLIFKQVDHLIDLISAGPEERLRE